MKKLFLKDNFFRDNPKLDLQRGLTLFGRSSYITEFYKGKLLGIHNGSIFQYVSIDDRHIKKRLGEFSITKKIGITTHLKTGKKLKIRSRVKVVKKKTSK